LLGERSTLARASWSNKARQTLLRAQSDRCRRPESSSHSPSGEGPAGAQSSSVSAAIPILEILFFIPAAAAWHDAGFTGYLATLFGWFAFLAFRLRRESNGVTVP
jgi:hypothetical protein